MAHIYHCLNEVSVHIIIIFSFILAYWSKRISDTRIHIQNCEHWTPNNEHTAHTTIQLLESHLKRMNYTPKRKIKTKRIEKPHWKGKTRADSQTMRHTQITMVLVHMHDKCVCTSIHIFIFIFIGGLLSKQANNRCMSCTIVHSGIRCSEPDSESNCVGVYLCTVQFMHALNDQLNSFYLPIAQFDVYKIFMYIYPNWIAWIGCFLYSFNFNRFLEFFFIFNFYYFFLPLWLVV